MAFDEPRTGETAFSMGFTPSDAGLVFIGVVKSAWLLREECPKNLRQARERDASASVLLSPPFAEGFVDVKAGDWVYLLTFLDQARRDLASQVPRHADGPRGTFSLRSPVRPNPIGLHLVQITAIDQASGRFEIDAIDVLDGTPLLDIKPYLPGVDAPPQR